MKFLLMTAPLWAMFGCGQLPRDADPASWLQANMSTPGLPPRPPALSATRERDREPWSVVARQAEARGDVSAAIEAYRQWAQALPTHAEPLHRLAVLHDKQGDHEQAAPLYLNAMRLAPQDAGLLTDYAYSRYIQGDLEVAEGTLRRSLTLEPELQRAHNNLALVLARQGRDEQAIASFQKGGLSRQAAIENLQQARHAAELSIQEPRQSSRQALERYD